MEQRKAESQTQQDDGPLWRQLLDWSRRKHRPGRRLARCVSHMLHFTEPQGPRKHDKFPAVEGTLQTVFHPPPVPPRCVGLHMNHGRLFDNMSPALSSVLQPSNCQPPPQSGITRACHNTGLSNTGAVSARSSTSAGEPYSHF